MYGCKMGEDGQRWASHVMQVSFCGIKRGVVALCLSALKTDSIAMPSFYQQRVEQDALRRKRVRHFIRRPFQDMSIIPIPTVRDQVALRFRFSFENQVGASLVQHLARL